MFPFPSKPKFTSPPKKKTQKKTQQQMTGPDGFTYEILTKILNGMNTNFIQILFENRIGQCNLCNLDSKTQKTL